MHDIEFRRSALKEIKKLDNPIRREMVFQIESCAEKPFKGKSLKGDLTGYLSYNFTFKGVNYRIIYTINELAKAITIEMAGTRSPSIGRGL